MTGQESLDIEENKRLSSIDISGLAPDDREWYADRRTLYYTPSNRIPREFETYYQYQTHLLNLQDPYRVRYAFTMAIPIVDVPAAIEDKKERMIAAWFRVSEEVLGHAGAERVKSINYLIAELGYTYKDAHYWLHLLVALILYRYGWTFIATYSDGVSFFPAYEEFLDIYGRSVSGVPRKIYADVEYWKKVTGQELFDEVDRIVYESTANLLIIDWIKIQHEEWEKRKKRISRFRTYLIIAMAAVVVIPTVIAAFKSALTVWSYVEGWQISLFAKFKLVLTAFTDVMGAGFSAFLTAIRYNTLIGIHKIAFLVSEDYRSVMRGVYSELSRVSSALGYGPYTLLLLTQNSKNLVHDVSSTLGMEWDLSEVQWLSTFQDYMKKFSGAAYKYRDNPEALLYDLSRWVEKDALNAKGAFMAGLTESVNKVIEDVADFIGDVTVIRDDIVKLVRDLPVKISGQINEAIGPYISQFDNFITDTYDPYRKEITDIVNAIELHQNEINTRANELVNRLKKPADYLLEIDSLSDEDRLDQEGKMADLSTREYYRDVDGFVPLSKPVSAELAKIRDAMKVSIPMDLGFPKEIAGPQRPKGVKATPRKTWFIGDY